MRRMEVVVVVVKEEEEMEKGCNQEGGPFLSDVVF